MSSSRKRSHHHNDDDSDDNEIKSIPFKKQCEEVKIIKIVRDGSPVPVSPRIIHEGYSVSYDAESAWSFP